MYRRLLACITVSALSAPAVASDQKPSNFRRTSIATGGSLGLDFSHVFEQKLDDERLDSALGSIPAGSIATNLDMETNEVLTRFAAGWSEGETGIEVYLQIGAVEAKITGASGATSLVIDRGWAFAIGGGARYRFLYVNGFSLFTDVSGRWSEATADITVGGTAQPGVKMEMWQWEGSLYASYDIKLDEGFVIAPYGGLLLSGSYVDLKGVFRTDQRDVFGVLGGVEVGINERVTLYAEGRFVNQTTVTVGLAIGF